MKTVWKNVDEYECADIHCHILPGIDDGAKNFDESVKMLREARKNGIRRIVATPHIRKNDFDFDFAENQFNILCDYAVKEGVELRLGYEVNIGAIGELGFDKLDKLSFVGSNYLLLEFNNYSLPPNWELIIRKIQDEGKRVIIAHPERYAFIQRDIKLARKMADMGCRLQCDSYVFDMNMLSKEKRTANRMINEGLITWIATDAHSHNHYEGYKEILEDYIDDLKLGTMTFGA